MGCRERYGGILKNHHQRLGWSRASLKRRAQQLEEADIIYEMKRMKSQFRSSLSP